MGHSAKNGVSSESGGGKPKRRRRPAVVEVKMNLIFDPVEAAPGGKETLS